MSKLSQIDKNRLPKHIAIIMDGNGRWAKSQGLKRVLGHKRGTRSVRQTVEVSAEIGVKNLTLFAFSTENWGRPKLEIKTLMELLVSSLKKELKTMMDNDICLTTIGRRDQLPSSVQKELKEVIEKTSKNKRMNLVLALSYGGREELVKATRNICELVQQNSLKTENIDEETLQKNLYTQELPDVDLMIRTGGEKRISNFLLWQIAYAELYFTKTLWPDFTKEHFFEALINYQNRERRFGKISEQL
ncbi:MAG TPA: isoprenyl transferase [Flavobacteriaceae bacterium]|nr:isoprenyl transferase [Flavobacteriaceae bacterium]